MIYFDTKKINPVNVKGAVSSASVGFIESARLLLGYGDKVFCGVMDGQFFISNEEFTGCVERALSSNRFSIPSKMSREAGIDPSIPYDLFADVNGDIYFKESV